MSKKENRSTMSWLELGVLGAGLGFGVKYALSNEGLARNVKALMGKATLDQSREYYKKAASPVEKNVMANNIVQGMQSALEAGIAQAQKRTSEKMKSYTSKESIDKFTKRVTDISSSMHPDEFKSVASSILRPYIGGTEAARKGSIDYKEQLIDTYKLLAEKEHPEIYKISDRIKFLDREAKRVGKGAARSKLFQEGSEDVEKFLEKVADSAGDPVGWLKSKYGNMFNLDNEEWDKVKNLVDSGRPMEVLKMKSGRSMPSHLPQGETFLKIDVPHSKPLYWHLPNLESNSKTHELIRRALQGGAISRPASTIDGAQLILTGAVDVSRGAIHTKGPDRMVLKEFIKSSGNLAGAPLERIYGMSIWKQVGNDYLEMVLGEGNKDPAVRAMNMAEIFYQGQHGNRARNPRMGMGDLREQSKILTNSGFSYIGGPKSGKVFRLFDEKGESLIEGTPTKELVALLAEGRIADKQISYRAASKAQVRVEMHKMPAGSNITGSTRAVATNFPLRVGLLPNKVHMDSKALVRGLELLYDDTGNIGKDTFNQMMKSWKADGNEGLRSFFEAKLAKSKGKDNIEAVERLVGKGSKDGLLTKIFRTTESVITKRKGNFDESMKQFFKQFSRGGKHHRAVLGWAELGEGESQLSTGAFAGMHSMSVDTTVGTGVLYNKAAKSHLLPPGADIGMDLAGGGRALNLPNVPGIKYYKLITTPRGTINGMQTHKIVARGYYFLPYDEMLKGNIDKINKNINRKGFLHEIASSHKIEKNKLNFNGEEVRDIFKTMSEDGVYSPDKYMETLGGLLKSGDSLGAAKLEAVKRDMDQHLGKHLSTMAEVETGLTMGSAAGFERTVKKAENFKEYGDAAHTLYSRSGEGGVADNLRELYSNATTITTTEGLKPTGKLAKLVKAGMGETVEENFYIFNVAGERSGNRVKAMKEHFTLLLRNYAPEEVIQRFFSRVQSSNPGRMEFVQRYNEAQRDRSVMEGLTHIENTEQYGDLVKGATLTSDVVTEGWQYKSKLAAELEGIPENLRDDDLDKLLSTLDRDDLFVSPGSRTGLKELIAGEEKATRSTSIDIDISRIMQKEEEVIQKIQGIKVAAEKGREVNLGSLKEELKEIRKLRNSYYRNTRLSLTSKYGAMNSHGILSHATRVGATPYFKAAERLEGGDAVVGGDFLRNAMGFDDKSFATGGEFEGMEMVLGKKNQKTLEEVRKMSRSDYEMIDDTRVFLRKKGTTEDLTQVYTWKSRQPNTASLFSEFRYNPFIKGERAKTSTTWSEELYLDFDNDRLEVARWLVGDGKEEYIDSSRATMNKVIEGQLRSKLESETARVHTFKTGIKDVEAEWDEASEAIFKNMDTFKTAGKDFRDGGMVSRDFISTVKDMSTLRIKRGREEEVYKAIAAITDKPETKAIWDVFATNKDLFEGVGFSSGANKEFNDWMLNVNILRHHKKELNHTGDLMELLDKVREGSKVSEDLINWTRDNYAFASKAMGHTAKMDDLRRMHIMSSMETSSIRTLASDYIIPKANKVKRAMEFLYNISNPTGEGAGASRQMVGELQQFPIGGVKKGSKEQLDEYGKLMDSIWADIKNRDIGGALNKYGSTELLQEKFIRPHYEQMASDEFTKIASGKSIADFARSEEGISKFFRSRYGTVVESLERATQHDRYTKMMQLFERSVGRRGWYGHAAEETDMAALLKGFGFQLPKSEAKSALVEGAENVGKVFNHLSKYKGLALGIAGVAGVATLFGLFTRPSMTAQGPGENLSEEQIKQMAAKEPMVDTNSIEEKETVRDKMATLMGLKARADRENPQEGYEPGESTEDSNYKDRMRANSQMERSSADMYNNSGTSGQTLMGHGTIRSGVDKNKLQSAMRSAFPNHKANIRISGNYDSNVSLRTRSRIKDDLN